MPCRRKRYIQEKFPFFAKGFACIHAKVNKSDMLPSKRPSWADDFNLYEVTCLAIKLNSIRFNF